MTKHYTLPNAGNRRPRRFIRTGEFRAPRKGEYYLSGAIPEAYAAPNDLSTEFHILKEINQERAENDEGAPMRKVLGYANHETATVVLDIDNTRETQDYWRAAAAKALQAARASGSLTKRDIATLRLAERLESEHDDKRPAQCNGNDVYSTLMSAALGRVDWQEVAEHCLIKHAESR